MTKEKLDAVLDRVRSWPEARQEDAVNMLLTMEKLGAQPYRLSPEERTEIEAALAEFSRGEVASDEEVEALFARYRG